METTTRPLDDDPADCPDCRANETHLLDLVDSLSTLVGWQTQRIARPQDTVRALGDEADRLVTERDEARAHGRGYWQIAWDTLDDMAKLRATITEPCIEEPTGLGSVVRDRTGTLWVRVGSYAGQPWEEVCPVRDDGACRWDWDHIDAVKVEWVGLP